MTREEILATWDKVESNYDGDVHIRAVIEEEDRIFAVLGTIHGWVEFLEITDHPEVDYIFEHIGNKYIK